MVEQFALRLNTDGRKLAKQIRDRCDVCYVPRCWSLKDPKDKGQIFLSKKYLKGEKWRKAQIRHVLFQIVYGQPVPVGRVIRMCCGNTRCVNPGHMTVAGWKPTWAAIHTMIGNNWLTEEQAERWHQDKAEMEDESRLEDDDTRLEAQHVLDTLESAAH